MLKKTILILIIISSFSLHACTAKSSAEKNFNLAAQAYKKKDYSKAKQYYEQAVAQNLAEAQFGLGAMYAYGQGVAQDLSI